MIRPSQPWRPYIQEREKNHERKQFKRIYNALNRLAKSEKKKRHHFSRWDEVLYKNGYIYATNEFAGIRLDIGNLNLKDNEMLNEDVTYLVDENGEFFPYAYDAPPLETFFNEWNHEDSAKDFAFNPKLMKYVLDVFQACELTPICCFDDKHLMINFRGCKDNIEAQAVLMCVRM